MQTKLTCLFFTLYLLQATSLHSASRLKIYAGDYDRSQSIVSFTLPSSLASANVLRADSGKKIPLQVDPQGNATFVEPNLPRGTSKIYAIFTSTPPFKNRAYAVPVPHGVELKTDQLPPLFYQSSPGPLPRPDIPPVYLRGGYLHPIVTPQGRRVSDDYPHNHLHHHGIWFAWTKTVFQEDHPDFWNMGQKSGTVEFVDLDHTWNGPVHSGLQSRHVFRELVTSDKEIVLNESWTINLFQKLDTPQAVTVFDVKSQQTCATEHALQLPKYHYGGMGFRGHGNWDGKDNAFWLTSEGITDRVKGHATRSRWCYMGGMVDGQQAGIVILCHPENYRFPQPMRIHPTEPFFCYAPQQLGPMELLPGQPYVSRYRYVVLDGVPQAAFIDQLYSDFAYPPKVEIVHP